MPGLDRALAEVFRSSPTGPPVVKRRVRTPYSTTFPCEVVTCRLGDESTLRLFCKYGPKNGACSFGQRGGVAYEAEVFRRVLRPSGFSTPGFYGSYTDEDGGVWLLVEYLNRSLRAGKFAGLRAMKLAARWIGHFHAAHEGRGGEPSLSFLIRYSEQWYRGWPRRAFRSARRLGVVLPGVAAAKRIENAIAGLAALPCTVIHGEYYPHNILFQGGRIRPVDWETAAIAPGELDVATMTEGWSRRDSRELEEEYRQARWPNGAPEDFFRNLDLARVFIQLRWLGDDDADRARNSANRARWNRLYEVGRRLRLAPAKGRAA